MKWINYCCMLFFCLIFLHCKGADQFFEQASNSPSIGNSQKYMAEYEMPNASAPFAAFNSKNEVVATWEIERLSKIQAILNHWNRPHVQDEYVLSFDAFLPKNSDAEMATLDDLVEGWGETIVGSEPKISPESSSQGQSVYLFAQSSFSSLLAYFNQ